MQLGSFRNRIIAAALLGAVGSIVAVVLNRRPQPPAPAPEPPRLGYSRNGSAPTPLAGAGTETTR
ncbi:hypothetical protein IU501_23200 [Nocardia otitidiscaviarum]|uniref:Uncharacterized protein n=1 Tax=Nocardia otitidiscaviarum TaxID=1823 RepID=A0A378YDE6_9NOCA|nr:hypothetical protein [Nocardia otitidiscaviarum]MBF6135903.1 hypothetical protein [Nocardia otitidiscaviarum]MBF6237948.1 hypothetical protein [Nocardia otitidiscaviarum]MBF6483658.1 hypothetical protein [Nocardia otitidiscaviarum]SUA74743.1 Uncharacterised protein [Nocardia otitidiscaviarum]